MQEKKWKFGRYRDPETTEHKWCYYKVRQRLTWQFYIRVTQSWLTPCTKCQEQLDAMLQKKPRRFLRNGTEEAQAQFGYLCYDCKARAYKTVCEGTIILGNKAYEPAIELSRKYIDIEKTQTEISEKEYRQMK